MAKRKPKVEAVVDDRNERIDSARSLTDATSRDNYLEGYASINAVDEHHEISQLAYEYYLERGERHGSPEDDWLRAEQEIRRRRAASFRQGDSAPPGGTSKEF